MRILGKDRLQHLIEPAGVQDGAFHERDAGDIERRKAGEMAVVASASKHRTGSRKWRW